MSHRANSAIPALLNVRDGARAIDFYKAAFGATPLFCAKAGA